MERDSLPLRASRAPPRAALAAPPEPPPERWSRLGCLATFLVPFVGFSLTGALLARAIGLRTQIIEISAAELLARTLIVDIPLIAATILLARLLLRASPAALGLRRPRSADLRYALVFGSGLFVAAVAIGLVQAAALGKEQQAIARALLGHRGPLDLAMDLIAVAVLTPVAEELLFRGVLFGGLRQRMGFLAAAVVSAAIFTAVHEVQAWPGVFFLGFALALAYERTRNLWASIGTHGVVNALPLVLVSLAS